MPAALVFKTIKPKRLQDAEMKRVLRNANKRVGYGMRKDFEATVKTWDHEVKFQTITTLVGNESPSVLVGTDDEIYGYVNNGTEEHPIYAVNAQALHFKKVYTAKTVPGVIGSQSGGSSGDDVFAQSVLHPGTEARHFDKTIQAKWQPRYKREMEDAMKEARAVSGNAI